MIVVKEFKNNEYVYDNTVNTSKPSLSRVIVNDEIINFDFHWLIDTQFTEGNIGPKLEDYKSKLGFGLYTKAPCGGFLNFYKVQGSMGNNYIIFSGVNEVSNSHYVVIIHKVISEKNC